MSKKDKAKTKQNLDKLPPVEAAQHTNEIISMVAHELKNPLASIRGYSELLMSGAVGTVTPEQQNFLRVILANTDRMSELLADLSDAARLDSGNTKLNLTCVDALPIIQGVVASLQQQVTAKNISLELKFTTVLPDIIADPLRLTQIFMNLISNSVKYTQSGGKVSITSQINERDVIFAVQDSGLGISEKDQKLIFSRYYRSEDVQSRDIPGTGLGLYITRRLVEMQNGKIWFESVLGKGTTFYFCMPY